MLREERQRRILERINAENTADVDELADLVKVSVSTIRRDLKELAAKELVTRTHGGAVAASIGTSYETPTREKFHLRRAEKEHIARLALEVIDDGDSVILDSGTTTQAIARQLHQRSGLTVITYDLRIALETVLGPRSTMLVAGGSRREGFDIVLGSETERFFRRMSADKAFLGADAVHFAKGITNAHMAEVGVKQCIIEAAKQVFLVCDHTKFGKSALMHVAPVEAVDCIISDPDVDPAFLEEAQNAGICLETGSTRPLSSQRRTASQ